MSDVQSGLGNKLENVFLAILRVVILVVLALSLVAAVALGVWAVKDMGASPTPYKSEAVDNKALIQELKKSLESAPAASQPAPQKSNSSKGGKAENKALEEELGKQLKVVSDFLSKFEKNLNNPDGFKADLRKKANTLALEPQSEASVLAYAKGQTDLFSLALADPEIIAILKKKDDDAFGNYFSAAVDIYPDFFERQAESRKEFEAEESARVLGAKAGAMMKLSIAGGMFGTFLLISLILVLVKIERNLRVRPV
jgi:hypothetical protein